MRRVWTGCFFLAACSTQNLDIVHRTQAPETVTTANTMTEKRTLVSQGRDSGFVTITTDSDGAIGIVYHQVENGRGPHVEATVKLAPDWTIASFGATGKHEMGTKVAETFSRDGKRVTWSSEEEHGEATLTKPTFFIPFSDVPTDFLLVPAALKAGGTIALLPGGEATVTKAATMEIAANGQKRTIVAYAVAGVGLEPYYTWFNPDGTWFGVFSEFMSEVPDGWAPAVEAIVAKQRELKREREAAIALQTATRPISGIAFTNARVLDVEKGTWVPNQTVVVVGDTIKTIGPSGKVKVPEGIDEVALDGKALIPGLVDMHSHTDATTGLLDIASGVTTARDVGNDPDLLDDLKARFDAGTAVGPSLVRMGFIEGRNEKAASSKVTAETPDEAHAAVEFYAKRGYDGIKIYNSVKPELVPLLAADAHARKMLVTGHIPVHMLAHEAIDAGYDGIEHINMLFLNFLATHDTDTRDTTRFTLVGDRATEVDLNGAPFKDFVAQLQKHKTVIDPTLDAFEDLFVGQQGRITPGLEDLSARLPVQVRRYMLVGGLPMDAAKRAHYAQAWDRIFAMVKALWQAKVTVVAGTDNLGGLYLHHELELLARTGIPNADVLRMATLDAAKAMRLEKRIGSISAGKRADLVVVDGDPILDIKQVRKTVYTMRAGILYKTDALYKAAGVAP